MRSTAERAGDALLARLGVRGGALCGAVLCLGLGLASDAGCRARPRTARDEIVLAIETPLVDLDPRTTRSGYDIKLSRLVCAGLTSVDDAAMRPRLELAASVVAEDGDARTWLATLRPDARFADGTPVTAEDVRFTFASILDPATASADRAGFLEIQAMEVLDERRIRFHLTEPHVTFLTDLDMGIVPEHALRASGGRFADGRVFGAGPFQVISFAPDEVVLAPNDHWFGGAVRPRRVVVKVLRDDNARMLALAGGSIDLIQNAVPPPLVDAAAAVPDLRVDAAPSAIWTYLALDCDDPALSDRRVRQAIALGIDRAAIVRAKFLGRAVLATGLLAPSHWAYSAEVPHWSYDPARARALLDDAGLRDPGGGRPRLHLVYKVSADRFRVEVAESIAFQLRAIGLDVEVRPEEFAVLFDDLKRGSYQMASLQLGEVTEPDFYYRFFDSAMIPTAADPDRGANRFRYRNPLLDRLVEEGRATLDPSKRLAIYAAVQRLVATDLPAVPLWHEDNVVVRRAEVEGYTILPNARLDALVATWKDR